LGGDLFNKIKWIVLFFLSVLLVYTCGYRFSGSGGFPDNVEKIFIEIVENRTSKAGIERVVTNQLVFEFTRQREKSLASDPQDADATLKGVIQSISTKTISRVGTQVASEREVTMTLDLKLIKHNGKVIWVAKGLSDRQAYDVSDLKLDNDRNENLAIARLSERISERVFSRLTDDF
jgi:outer membrane lipopolysaccharide assembly protein LptE/RlpB